MPDRKTVWFGMKVSPEQKRRIVRLAKRRGLTQKDAVMAAVDAALIADRDEIDIRKDSFLDAYEKYCGAVNGPGDLNLRRKEYLQQYGQSSREAG